MVASHHFSRVDTLKLKDFIYRKVGQKRADNYFDQLKKFLSFKVNKADFDKSCIETIGRENLFLHNQLIQSILQNACHAKVPPQKPRKAEGLGVKVSSGYQKYCTKSVYGDMLLQSPRKCRSPVNRDRKFRDRPSPLGPLGKSPSLTVEETIMTQEQPNGKDLHSLNSRPIVDDGEEVNQVAGSTRFRRWGDITAPLGVFQNKDAPPNVPLVPKHRNFAETCQSSFGLPDTRSLASRLREKLASDGVEISLDCVNLINNGLDVFLKRLIEPCLGVARSQSNGRTVAATNAIMQGRFTPRPLCPTAASMLDFRVAMESHPRILGDDWPTQLEKICSLTP
ncbi:hypothetical protein F511_10315 [Dorcoceras hygrometricum]|uniref:Transcriptional coactivator Hfi1/Transcriptional adapter 1 n=1 Tax=Dorcoceras hygrometricum TaxID=472368 RepID=A0A2Z7C5I2_9LAMI|nr:hypothetical protein F511_10315 [Dorcoceras hygrometricum]